MLLKRRHLKYSGAKGIWLEVIKNPLKHELKEAERNILRMNQIPLKALDGWINRQRSDGAVFTHGLHQRHVAPDGLRPASFLGSRCIFTGPCSERLISAGLQAPQSTPPPRGEERGEEACTMLRRGERP